MFEQLIVTVSDCVPRKENIDVVLLWVWQEGFLRNMKTFHRMDQLVLNAGHGRWQCGGLVSVEYTAV